MFFSQILKKRSAHTRPQKLKTQKHNGILRDAHLQRKHGHINAICHVQQINVRKTKSHLNLCLPGGILFFKKTLK